jgi:NhaP-type Na+/H+ or K+/H+ antiporter
MTSAAAVAAAVALILFGVAVALFFASLIHRTGALFIPESGVTVMLNISFPLVGSHDLMQVLVGMAFGVVIRYAFSQDVVENASFNNEAFVLLLLPVIMFHSGFTGDRRLIFSNLWTILLFAVFGTLISAVVMGVIIYYAGVNGASVPLSWSESMAVGSLLSATDPVGTLAVFSSMRVEPVLNAIVFGEAVANDAVRGEGLIRSSVSSLWVDICRSA